MKLNEYGIVYLIDAWALESKSIGDLLPVSPGHSLYIYVYQHCTHAITIDVKLNRNIWEPTIIMVREGSAYVSPDRSKWFSPQAIQEDIERMVREL